MPQDAPDHMHRILELRLKHTQWRLTSWLQPHEYLINPESPDDEWLLDAMLSRLKSHGYWDTYGGYWNQYLEIGGYRYWAIDRGLNRERLPISRHWPGSKPTESEQ